MTILDSAEVLDDLGVTSPSDAQKRRMERSISSAQRAVEQYLGYQIERKTNTEFYPQQRQRLSRDEFVDVKSGRVSFGREGDACLILSARPVINNSTLAVYQQIGAMAGQGSGSFPVSSLLTKGSDYYLDVLGTANYSMSGILYRRAGVWPDDPGSIKVVYDSGFTAADFAAVGSAQFPQAAIIYDCVFEEAKRDFRQRLIAENNIDKPGTMTSENIGPYSYSAGGNTAAFSNVLTIGHDSKLKLQPWRKLGGRLA